MINKLIDNKNNSLTQEISRYFLFCLVIILILSIFTIFYLGLLHEQIKMTTKTTLPIISSKNKISSQTQKINTIVFSLQSEKLSKNHIRNFQLYSEELMILSNTLLKYVSSFDKKSIEIWALNSQIRQLDQSIHNYLYLCEKYMNQKRLKRIDTVLNKTLLTLKESHSILVDDLQRSHLFISKYELQERKKLENIIEFSIISFFLVLIGFILFYMFIWKKIILKLRNSFKVGTEIIKYQMKHKTKVPVKMKDYLTDEVDEFVNAISKILNRQLKAEQKASETEKKLLTIRNEERLDLSQFIHDHLGQSITAIQLFLSTLEKSFATLEDRQVLLFKNIDSCIKEAVEITKTLSRNLSSPNLTKRGLRNSLQELINSRNELKLTKFTYNDNYHSTIPFKLSIVIFQCIQECVNNCLKHARAKNGSIIIKEKKKKIYVFFTDDGKGFDKSILRKKTFKQMGLKGIRHSVNKENGHLRISSLENRGTSIMMVFML